MSDLFAGANTSSNLKEEKDVVRGARREMIPSSIQNLIVKHAYLEKKKSGALFVNALLEVADGDQKERTIKVSECILSGDAKGNKNYYINKDKEEVKLPGFALIDDLFLLATGKSVCPVKDASGVVTSQQTVEMKTIKLYDFDEKKDLPKEVPMLTEVVGKGICGCVLNRIEDKTAQNAASGKYEPTGQTYSTNVVDKFLDPAKRRTVSEIKHDIDPDYQARWATKWNDQVDDQSTEVKGAGMKGAPAAAGGAAEKTDLFAD